jgi:SH3-like domain-containing protein
LKHLGVGISQMGVARSSGRSQPATFADEHAGIRRLKLGRVRAIAVAGLGLVWCMALVCGCSRFRPQAASQYVYVTAKQQTLRDRVAAVSNRTGTVQNGDKLKVLEHGRRFLRVQAENGETGWIEERTVVGQDVYDAFAALVKEHEHDPAVATGVVRDEVYVHLTPGRSTEKFYRLAEGDKLSLLERATLPKSGGLKPGALRNPRQAAIPGADTGIPSGAPVAVPSSAVAASSGVAAAKIVAKPGEAISKPNAAGLATMSGAAGLGDSAPPVMEDWWLVRDQKGHAGWVLSRMMDVDAPDALSRYAEGQRIVGAYVLATVNDPEAPQADKNVPEYVTVLSPYKSGLPYDFDQVRVFTWNPKMHRYETAFREKNIEGYLPVAITRMTDPNGKSANATTPMPAFQYKVLSATAPPVVPNPETGAIVPGPTITKTYRLEGNVLRRLLAPGVTAPEEAHPEMVTDKKKKEGKKRR